ncbi:zinc-ribbon domain-containing protein [Candidatus Micrarchaeota archaeon]|nr:zinc-ribbon domain-containing protein [Candidatus Micrarchaeota archaeon]
MGKKLTIEEMQKLARTRGGKCLSEKHINIATKLRWQCKKRHEWEATARSVKNNKSWCPYCAGYHKTIEDMQELAKKHGGKCISKKYVGMHKKLTWQCAEGHTWETTPGKIKNSNRWCPKCRGGVKYETIKDMQELAKKRDGKCLSSEYINSRTNLIWQCKEGHTWKAISTNIKKGTWCPYCIGVAKPTMQEIQEIAKSKGGKCLSTEYVSTHTKLKWKCKEGHIWMSTPASIKYGSWCPICSISISERVCRRIFELIFNERFPKLRPRWLINSRGNRTELDGYCKKLGIAFEYQGKQHYLSSRMLSKSRNVEQYKEEDEFKRQVCRKHNIILIEVPYTVDFEAMPNYIIKICKAKGIRVPKITKSLDYRLMDIYSPEKIKGMQELAAEKGGKCLSKRYVNSTTKLKWQCKEGHVWEATPRDVKYHTWCPYCARNVRLSIEDMQRIAESRGGKCLSDKYINSQTKLKWQCKQEHEWMARPNDIRQGQWCPVCTKEKRGKKS